MGTLRSLDENLYIAMLNDQREASPRFVALRKAYLALAERELNDQNTRQETVNLLARMQDLSTIYLSNHGGPHGTRKGRERFGWATRLRELSGEQYNQIHAELSGGQREIKQFFERNALEHPEDMSGLARLGKLQRNIGRVNFVPRVTDFQLQPSRWQRFKDTVARGVSHLFNAVFGMTTGLVSLGVSLPFTRTGEYENIANRQESDMTLVPGTQTDEHFEVLHPEEGPENQPVIGDRRRVPVNYEEVIPEDPNAPPTLTLCFEQGTEGKTKAMGGPGGEGHCFISLKYTRDNPITGKAERYKCTFGFYPHQNFESLMATAAMGATGMVIPGSLENDNDHSYSTSKTFQVTNKTINTVFNSASDYSKGGYNYLSRSCATFAHDMCVSAGIDPDPYFRKTDFEGFRSNALKGFSTLGTQTISRLGTHSMLSHAEDKIIRYERFNQRLINREDVQRLSRQKFYARLRGYVPSVATEAVRNDWDFHLSSNNYTPSVPEEREEDPDRKLSNWSLSHSRMLAEQMTLLHSVERFLRKNKIPAQQCAEIRTNLTEFMSTNNRLIENYGKIAFADDYRWAKGEKPRYLQRREACRPGSKAVKDYIEGLDEIFRTTFKSDARLNISFQHMASTLQKLDNGFAAQYRNIQNKIFEKGRDFDTLFEDEEVLDYLNAKKENFHLMARLKFSRSTLGSDRYQLNTSNPFQPEYMVGLIKSFGSLDEFMRQRKELVDAERDFGADSKQYKALLDKHEDKLTTAQNFQNAISILAGKESFNDHDLEFAFRELPKGIATTAVDRDSDPASIYQGLIVASYLKGMRTSCEKSVKEIRKNYMEKKEALEGFKDLLPVREYSQKLAELKIDTRNALTKSTYDFVADKLKTCPKLDNMIKFLRETKYRDNEYDPAHPDPEIETLAERDALWSFSTLICEDIARPMLLDIAHELSKEEKRGLELDNAQLEQRKNNDHDFDSLITTSVNTSRIQVIEGSGELMTFYKEKFPPKAFLSEEDTKTYTANEKAQIAQECLYDRLKEKKPEDVKAVGLMAKEQSKALAELVRSGRGSLQDPETKELFSQSLVTAIIAADLNRLPTGMEQKVNAALISRETEKLKAYGVMDELTKDANQPLVQSALGGNVDAKAKLVTLLTTAQKNLSPQKKKAVDADFAQRELLGKDEPNPLLRDTDIQRRFSISQKPNKGPVLP